MNSCRYAHDISSQGSGANIPAEHLEVCKDCAAALARIARFDSELITAAHALTGPPLPARSVVASTLVHHSPATARPILLFATVTAVIMLAVVVGASVGVLLDRGSTQVGGPTPEPEPTSPYLHSRQEFLVLVAECVRDEGYASVRVDVWESKIDFADRSDVLRGGPDAVRACIIRVDPARHDPPPPRSERQLRALYDFRLAQARCLEAEGYAVSEPPTLEQFLEMDAGWDPAETMSAPQTIRTRCEYVPQRPDWLDW